MTTLHLHCSLFKDGGDSVPKKKQGRGSGGRGRGRSDGASAASVSCHRTCARSGCEKEGNQRCGGCKQVSVHSPSLGCTGCEGEHTFHSSACNTLTPSLPLVCTWEGMRSLHKTHPTHLKAPYLFVCFYFWYDEILRHKASLWEGRELCRFMDITFPLAHFTLHSTPFFFSRAHTHE